MKPSDCEKTAFSTDKGHFEYLLMPFGLKGVSGIFQRLMNKVLTGSNRLKAFVYLDDIIYAKDIPEHTQKLSEIFQRLRQYRLKLQPLKCEFLRKEVTYLGHNITDEGVKPDPQKVESVKNFLVPKNVKEVKSFLGLSGYYRRFIRNYGQTALLKKDVPYVWSDLCRQHSFEILKELLITAPILQYPNFTKPFNLTCDASDFAIECVLLQGPIGKDLQIAFASRTLNKAEINYNTTEKKPTSIVWGIKLFRPYLFGQKFNIVTDHRALVWLFNIKDPGSRLTRWLLQIEEYQYTIHFKPGVNNTNADALSSIQMVTTRSQSTSSHQDQSEPQEIQENSEPLEYSNHLEYESEVDIINGYQVFLKAEETKLSPTKNVLE